MKKDLLFEKYAEMYPEYTIDELWDIIYVHIKHDILTIFDGFIWYLTSEKEFVYDTVSNRIITGDEANEFLKEKGVYHDEV